jgi:DNA-binding beta-propeller fold protein YncE
MVLSKRGLRLLGAVALAPVAAVGCEQILGLESGELRPTTTSSTTTEGTGAAAGHAGQAGTGGQGPGGSGGHPANELLAKGHGKPVLITSDGENVYWTNEGSTDGRVMKVPVDGGPDAEVVVASNQGSPVGIAQLDNEIYWTSEDDNAIRKALKDAGTCDSVSCSQFAGGLSHPGTLAIAPQTLVWSEIEPVEAGTVRRSPLSPLNATDLATQQGAVWQLATGGGYVYWLARSDGRLRRAPLGGGSAEVVWEELLVPPTDQAGVAVSPDGAWVYWTNPDEGKVSRASVTDGFPAARTVLASGQNKPVAVVADDSNLYWLNLGTDCIDEAGPPTGSVMRRGLPADGGAAVETLADTLCLPKGIALDDNNVYWTVWGAGEVYRRRK